MRLMFVADARSPTALNWIEYFLNKDHEVHLVSTFPCLGDSRLASFELISVAFSGLKKFKPQELKTKNILPQRRTSQFLTGASALRLRTAVRQWLGPLSLPAASEQLRKVVERVQPELVHALRIPFEGMVSALAEIPAPLLVSIWGNDFTLHATSAILMKKYTQITMQRANGLNADCHRDIRLAQTWGYSIEKPFMVIPGSGGVQPTIYYPAPEVENPADRLVTAKTVINPRGFRAYVCNQAFFYSIPLVLAKHSDTRFICPGMAGEAQAIRWVNQLGLQGYVELLPHQTRQQMATLFRNSRVSVSPTIHDGTPNTLLEAMACGCLPIAGDLESIREWIIPGSNGLLVDPTDPNDIAVAIVQALEDEILNQSARQLNLKLIEEKASYPVMMQKAEGFYKNYV